MKTFAWNFNIVESGVLVRRAISQDSIGVLKLEDGFMEFWHMGARFCRTKSWNVLFRAISKVEKST